MIAAMACCESPAAAVAILLPLLDGFRPNLQHWLTALWYAFYERRTSYACLRSAYWLELDELRL